MTTFKQLLGKPAQGSHEIYQIQAEADGHTVYTSSEELDRALSSKIAKMHLSIGGEQHAARVCAAVLSSGQFIVLSTPEYARGDTADKIRAACRQKNTKSGPVEIYMVTPNLLLSLQNRKSGSNRISSDREDSAYNEAFSEIIAWGVQNNASDVNLNVAKDDVKSQIKFHIDGLYVAPPRWSIETARLEEILNVAWQSNHGGVGAVLAHDTESQCRVETVVDGQKVIGRWAGMAADRGLSVTIRLQKVGSKTPIRSLNALGYLPSQVEAFDRAQRSEGGAIVFSGVVGSGKTEGLGSLITRLGYDRKIISVEDPVELELPNVIQNTVARSLQGGDEDAFLAKQRTLKRSAPHDVYLGEIRDIETGRTFQDVTSSGTNLYSTVHAPSAGQVPERLYSNTIGIAADFLSSPGVLKLLVHQALAPKICPHCAMPLLTLAKEGGEDFMQRDRNPGYWSDYCKRIERLYDINIDALKVRNPSGCSKCQNKEIPQLNGYAGRTSIVEMIEPPVQLGILKFVRDRDPLGLQLYLDNLERTAVDHPDMTNKSMMECAMYKATQGMFDVRDIEMKTSSFDTVELIQKNKASRK
ncbi:ATPase, T2SS/T4P/T4SS family [Pseudomonas sp. EMN2]|uniref:ATPase, T2SS/T4P/T4SS family n=1 Tax=Pseudomonas sp. EMN2 TaxID=2615212 RepID=UPI00129A1C8B|nr:ATPase, T2SS/T4P/T4SS family [Pseudomonas sp. EMN2]